MNNTIAVALADFMPMNQLHLEAIKTYLKYHDEVVIIVDKSDRASSYNTPLDVETRINIINDILTWNFKPRQRCRIRVDSIIADYYDDDLNNACLEATIARHNPHGKQAIIYAMKESDKLSDEFFNATKGRIADPNYKGLNTLNPNLHISDGLFDIFWTYFAEVDDGVKALRFVDEVKAVHAYRDKFKDMPFKPTFVTVDAVIFDPTMTEVVLIKRGGSYGNGLFALPGGFVEQGERLSEATLREVKEECGIELDADTRFLTVTADHPDRSARGRTFSSVSCFVLDDKVNPVAGDDAAQAMWIPIEDALSMRLFEDHLSILRGIVQNDSFEEELVARDA